MKSRIHEIQKEVGGDIRVHPGYDPKVIDMIGYSPFGKYQLLFEGFSVIECIAPSFWTEHRTGLVLEAYGRDMEEPVRFKTVHECVEFLKNYSKYGLT